MKDFGIYRPSLFAVISYVALLLILSVVSCNKQIIDLKLKYHTAVMRLPDGEVVKVKVKKWNDYDNSDQIQVISEGGTVYLVHSANVVLIGD